MSVCLKAQRSAVPLEQAPATGQLARDERSLLAGSACCTLRAGLRNVGVGVSATGAGMDPRFLRGLRGWCAARSATGRYAGLDRDELGLVCATGAGCSSCERGTFRTSRRHGASSDDGLRPLDAAARASAGAPLQSVVGALVWRATASDPEVDSFARYAIFKRLCTPKAT